ncbi:MAG: hypothetical protein JXR97_13055, partial [Planctomycetes bacterium]|nr:hypothetical protein [Planctomycetota bacterium]
MKKYLFAFFLASFLIFPTLRAEDTAKATLKLHGMFSDDMVLQRGLPVRVYGTDAAGTKVTVSILEASADAVAGEDGSWSVELPAMKAGGPYEVKVVGSSEAVLKNVLVGDVWICSGQSNMEWPLRNAKNAKEEIEDTVNYPEIRLYKVARRVAGKPMDDMPGKWAVCNPESATGFSAVGYFFGRELYKDIKVPIGLVGTSWGGTPAEAWTTYQTLENMDITKPIIERFQKGLVDFEDKIAAYRKAKEEWEKTRPKGIERYTDPGNKGLEMGWAKPDFDDSKWVDEKVPSKFDSAIDGVIWYRRAVEIPADWAGKDVVLSLGPIDDYDITYLN